MNLTRNSNSEMRGGAVPANTHKGRFFFRFLSVDGEDEEDACAVRGPTLGAGRLRLAMPPLTGDES